MKLGPSRSLPGRRSPLVGAEPLALPWTDAARLMEHCTACSACVQACPQQILRTVGGRTVEIDFSAPCTFCGLCAEACPEEVFAKALDPPWEAKAVIGTGCLETQGVSCRACEDSCEARALRAKPKLGGLALITLNLDACTGCGGCIPVCPTGAISVQRPVRREGTLDAA